MFRDTLLNAASGGNHARLSRAQGRVDGYMQALLDLGIATQVELLQLVAGERERAHGPAVGTFEFEAPRASQP